MGEGPWNAWEGTDSLLHRLLNSETAKIEGTGILKLEETSECAQNNESITSAGYVDFTLM